MSTELRQKLTRPSIWLRLVYMIVFAIAFNIAEIVIFGVAVFQFFSALFTKRPNARFTRFGRNLARYIHQIIAYLTFATDEKPFPFSSWPDEPEELAVKVMHSRPPAEENVVSSASVKKPATAKPKRRSPRTTTKPTKPKTPPKKDG